MKTCLGVALTALIVSSQASAMGLPVLIEGTDVHDYHFTVIEESYGVPTERQMNFRLQAGETIRVCLVHDQSRCGYLVPADRVPNVHTEYAQDTAYQGWFLWQYKHHSNPADYWKRGMQFRVCPIVIVDSKDTKPECQTIPQ